MLTAACDARDATRPPIARWRRHARHARRDSPGGRDGGQRELDLAAQHLTRSSSISAQEDGIPSGDKTKTLIKLIQSVTGVAARKDDHIASAGLDSLNMMKLLQALKQTFPGVGARRQDRAALLPFRRAPYPLRAPYLSCRTFQLTDPRWLADATSHSRWAAGVTRLRAPWWCRGRVARSDPRHAAAR
jgi:hypothetical protein